MSVYLCVWLTDPHSEFGSCVGTKGSQQWASCPKCPHRLDPCPGHCPLPSPARTLPAPSPGASRGTPLPNPQLCVWHRKTTLPIPSSPIWSWPAQRDGSEHVPPSPQGGVGLFQAGGKCGGWLQWHSDFFLEAKDKTAVMEGRWHMAGCWPLASATAGAGPAGRQGGRGVVLGGEERAWAPMGLQHVGT